MKQGEQGQMEGCQGCDRNRMDFEDGRGIAEEGRVEWTCQRSIKIDI